MAKKKQKMSEKILSQFQEISTIPRCSKNEQKIGEFLLQWAGQRHLDAQQDKIGNIVIRKPASAGHEDSIPVIIQGHLDMVCEKSPDSKHDFGKDPIRLVYDGDWLKADGTTLGADNGIALALAMVLATEKNIVHPPLELLFTVDEETGLTGANALEPGFIRGKNLLNVDSEDEGVFTVGCAGGRDTKISLPLQFGPVPAGYVKLAVRAGGVAGGHSGVNIGDERANALKLIARTLQQLTGDGEIRLEAISGGTVHNAIPREAEAMFWLEAGRTAAVAKRIAELADIFRHEFKNSDPGLKLTLEKMPAAVEARVLTKVQTQNVIDLLLALPHGVHAMSSDIKGLVETSNNMASVRMEGNEIKIITSQRSSVMSRLHAVTFQIEAVARLAGARAVSSVGYPAWQPDLKSPLLERCQKTYKRLFGKEAKVEAIHAGLECGIIGDKYSGMKMISIGPTLKNPHSPDEKLYIPSIGMVWDFLVELLKSLATEP